MESHFEHDEEIGFRRLVSTQGKLQSMMERANTTAFGLERMEKRLNKLSGEVSATAMAVAPLQSAAMVAKALDSRIDRAINPALRVLEKFGQVQQIQTTIADMLQQQQEEENQGASIYSASRVNQVQDLVETIQKLELSVGLLKDECEPAIQRLQEAVEFLCRTKATDYYRAHRLRETLSTLKALFESKVEDLNDGLLMEKALSRLEFEFTRILQNTGRTILKKALQQGVSIRDNDDVGCLDLASEQEIQLLRRIVEVMHGYDRSDDCIDIYVLVRWRRAAKALIRLKLDYLLNFNNIDDMEWEVLESSIDLWIEHFKISVSVVLASEKELCRQIFGDKDLVLLSECVGRIGRKDLKPQFYEIFEGDGGREICLEFRELQKQVVSAACKVFWEFGLLVEGQQDGAVPPADGSVPKLVKYAVAYMASLAGESYAPLMTKVLKIEHLWKLKTLSSVEGSPKGSPLLGEGSPKGPLPLGKWLTGICSGSEQNQNQNLFCEAVSNFMEALQRNLDSKTSAYKDRALRHLFTMNAQWYIYTRTKNTELGKLVGPCT
ncbi:hypothetical protein KI387_003316 [Taxus chinensis]|uniref:Exocyst subunit Exo70 family protein n=1 Tax=Taxus chinensis TaxID=29808 RepID=A0AA38GXJ3_TAXCH|nr:hypothetical protein KI387_003316 [Taxus chinensis]